MLPWRTLDLTGIPDIPSHYQDMKINLRETSGKRGQYTALSYYWDGDAQYHVKTTGATLQGGQSNIDYSNLPLTLQDAILITLALGVHHLWIDSLCIVQDSRQDWESQAANMADVYSGAFLTLAATSSANPKYGCLNYPQAPLCIPTQGGEAALVR